AACWARYVWKMAMDELPDHTIHSANECLIQSVTVSRLQRDVMSLFSGLYPGLKLEQEKLIGPTIVDGYFEINDQKVILEVYGPTHYNHSQKNQDTLDKEVLLKAMGYTVISISYKDWSHKNKGDRKAMLISFIDPLQEKSTGYVRRRR
ncbi:MAG: RAP domain-containing protein, partial [Pseudomonadota bacterium]|nr:RAP domain-containing protein [Pseudomonadota bacterium]